MATHDLKQIWFNREINQRLEEVLRGIAASHLNIVENGMRFQNLKQDKKILRLANGIVIESSICFGKQTSRVYVPPVPVLKPIAPEEELVFSFTLTRDIDEAKVDKDELDYLYIYREDHTQMLYYRRAYHEVRGIWTYNEETTTWKYEYTGELAGQVKILYYNETSNTWTIPIDDKYYTKDPHDRYFVRYQSGFPSNSPTDRFRNILTTYPHVYQASHYWDETNIISPDHYKDTVPYYRAITTKTPEPIPVETYHLMSPEGVYTCDDEILIPIDATYTVTKKMISSIPYTMTAQLRLQYIYYTSLDQFPHGVGYSEHYMRQRASSNPDGPITNWCEDTGFNWFTTGGIISVGLNGSTYLWESAGDNVTNEIDYPETWRIDSPVDNPDSGPDNPDDFAVEYHYTMENMVPGSETYLDSCNGGVSYCETEITNTLVRFTESVIQFSESPITT